jgi:hypothetical protein
LLDRSVKFAIEPLVGPGYDRHPMSDQPTAAVPGTVLDIAAARGEWR